MRVPTVVQRQRKPVGAAEVEADGEVRVLHDGSANDDEHRLSWNGRSGMLGL